jgi:hypothetical protein
MAESMTDKLVGIGLDITYFLLIASVALGLLMPLISALSNIRSLLKGLLGIAFIAVLFLIAFAFSTGNMGPEFAKFGIGPAESRIIGAGLISLYMLLVVSFVGIFVSEIINIFK